MPISPPASPAWYREWSEYHLLQFGIRNAESQFAFATWWKSFSAMGFTAHELSNATEAVRIGPKCIRVDDHYHAIKSAILAARSEAVALGEKRRRESDDRGRCQDCCDSGFVSVPHPRFCDATEWRPERFNRFNEPIYATCGVLCKCEIGRRMIAAQQQRAMDDAKTKTSMTLSQYEDRVNGNWREQMAGHESRRSTVSSVESGLSGLTSKELISRAAKEFAQADAF